MTSYAVLETHSSKTTSRGRKVVEPDPRIDDDMGEGEDDFCDPDVRVPHTKSQIFWYRLWKIRNWLGGKYVRFAMKNQMIITSPIIQKRVMQVSQKYVIFMYNNSLRKKLLSFKLISC